MQELPVHAGHRQAGRIPGIAPAPSLPLPRLRRAGPADTSVKQQDKAGPARPRLFFGEAGGPKGAFVDFQSELLANFPAQRKSWIFSRFHFPAGKLPLPRVGFVRQCLLQEQASIRVEDRPRDHQCECRIVFQLSALSQPFVKTSLRKRTLSDRTFRGETMVIRQFISRILRDNRGATAIEYGLIVALVALSALAAFQSLGASSGGAWGEVSSEVTNAMS